MIEGGRPPSKYAPASWTAPGMPKIVAIGSGVSVPQMRDFAVLFGVTSMFGFWGSSIRLQPTPLDGYLRKIRQMPSFRVRKCLFWGPDDYILYLDP